MTSIVGLEPFLTNSVSSVTFQSKDILTSAAQWTKTRIFDSKSSNGVRNGLVTGGGDAANCHENPVVHSQPTAGPDVTGATKISVSDEVVAVTYLQSNVIQLWKIKDDVSAMLYLGSLLVPEGKVLKVDILPRWLRNCVLILVQVSHKHSTYLDIYNLSYVNKSFSLYRRLTLPKSSDDPGPYYVYKHPSSFYAAIATSTGLVTIIRMKESVCEVYPLTGIEAELGPDNRPLITLSSGWLAFCPKKATKQSSSFNSAQSSNNVNDSIPLSHTNVELPPPGPLHERVIESLSAAAVASLKSLSDAGKAGLKHYLSKEQMDSNMASNGAHVSIPKKRHEMYGYYAENYYYFDDDKESKPGSPDALFGEGSGRKSGSPGSPPGLKTISNMFFGNPNTAKTVHIVDIKSKVTIGYFVPLHGVSALSLSLHDTALAVVSTKGDGIDTYDLSFLPQKVILSGRYMRGRSPAKTQSIVWSKLGGLGLSTWDKGSLHWFDKRRSYNSTNKIWKFSGWKIDEIGMLNASSQTSMLLVVRQGQIIVVDPTNGKCYSKFDIPLTPLGPDCNTAPYFPPVKNTLVDSADPLSQYELETCLPYPYIHNDPRLTISVIAPESMNKYFHYVDSLGNYSTTTFGLDIQGTMVDFGKGDGKIESIAEEDLIDAMEDCQLDSTVNSKINSELTSVDGEADGASSHSSGKGNSSIPETNGDDGKNVPDTALGNNKSDSSDNIGAIPDHLEGDDSDF